eukprot:TRINITY_DN7718_c0_g1_i1.p1 TRINITY_DN7718_c0_g1~~TRINITY_DN7718_c0_g1_i1.p1  ORF type:complete len:570 (+),score=80.59 TRINITY_DN7718_c0_g1_i1:26-1735(+)
MIPSLASQRSMLELVSKKLGVSHFDDWYKVSSVEAIRGGAKAVLRHYHDEDVLAQALVHCFPEHIWRIWRFNASTKSGLPEQFWHDRRNINEFFGELGRHLGVQRQDDWYQVKYSLVKEFGGGSLLKPENRFVDALKQVFPEVEWKEWRFAMTPPEFWNNSQNRLTFLRHLFVELGLKKMEDWYNVTPLEIRSAGGTGFLKYFDDDRARAIVETFPDYEWSKERFLSRKKGFLAEAKNQSEFVAQLEKQGLTNWNWYQGKNDLGRRTGAGALEDAVEAPWDIDSVWKDRYYQRQFLDDVSNKSNFKSMDDWYKVTSDDVIQHGGVALMKNFSMSVPRMLASIYPEFSWKMWKFTGSSVPKGFWENRDNVRDYMDWLYKELELRSLDDWFAIPKEKLVALGASTVLSRYKGLLALLQSLYPYHKWPLDNERKRKQAYGSKVQRALSDIVGMIFGRTEEVYWDYIHPELNHSSNRPMELDVFIPSLKLAFEYQGQQHFEDLNYVFDQVKDQKLRDSEKRQACVAIGISLIEIPFWWDRTKETLVAIICDVRPDLKEVINPPKLSSPSNVLS